MTSASILWRIDWAYHTQRGNVWFALVHCFRTPQLHGNNMFVVRSVDIHMLG